MSLLASQNHGNLKTENEISHYAQETTAICKIELENRRGIVMEIFLTWEFTTLSKSEIWAESV